MRNQNINVWKTKNKFFDKTIKLRIFHRSVRIEQFLWSVGWKGDCLHATKRVKNDLVCGIGTAKCERRFWRQRHVQQSFVEYFLEFYILKRIWERKKKNRNRFIPCSNHRLSSHLCCVWAKDSAEVFGINFMHEPGNVWRKMLIASQNRIVEQLISALCTNWMPCGA